MTRITLPASALHDLIVPVLPHAAVKDWHPVFNAVRLEIADDTLYTVATDRYTVAVARRPLGEPTPTGAINAPRDQIATALKLFKHTRSEDPELTVDIDDDRLRISDPATEVRLDIPAVATEPGPGIPPKTVEFIPWRKLFATALNREQAAKPCVVLSPQLVKRWDAAGRFGEPLRFLPGQDPRDPVLVLAGEHFAGLWQPARLPNVEAHGDWLKDLPWRDEITEPIAAKDGAA